MASPARRESASETLHNAQWGRVDLSPATLSTTFHLKECETPSISRMRHQYPLEAWISSCCSSCPGFNCDLFGQSLPTDPYGYTSRPSSSVQMCSELAEALPMIGHGPPLSSMDAIPVLRCMRSQDTDCSLSRHDVDAANLSAG